MIIQSAFYPGMTPSGVVEIYLKPAFNQALYTDLGHEKIEVYRHEQSTGKGALAIKRMVPVDMPSFAQKFFKAMSPIDHKVDFETTSGGMVGRFIIDMLMTPGKCMGEATFTQEPGGTRHVIRAKCEVNVPVIGKKLAQVLDANCEKAIIAEMRWNESNIANFEH